MGEFFDLKSLHEGDKKKYVFEGFDVKMAAHSVYEEYYDKIKSTMTKTYN